MKLWRVVDVNGDTVFDGLTSEDEAETYVERSHLAGVGVVEVDTVKEAAEDLLRALKFMADKCNDPALVAVAVEAIEKAERG